MRIIINAHKLEKKLDESFRGILDAIEGLTNHMPPALTALEEAENTYNLLKELIVGDERIKSKIRKYDEKIQEKKEQLNQCYST